MAEMFITALRYMQVLHSAHIHNQCVMMAQDRRLSGNPLDSFVELTGGGHIIVSL